MTPFDRLSALGLPFVIRSPDPTRHEQTVWCSEALTKRWVIEAYDHEKQGHVPWERRDI
jgi:hypothetical protein